MFNHIDERSVINTALAAADLATEAGQNGRYERALAAAAIAQANAAVAQAMAASRIANALEAIAQAMHG